MSFLADISDNFNRMSSKHQSNTTSTARGLVQLPANLLKAFIPGYGTISSLLSELLGFDITLLVSISFLIFALIKSIDFLRAQFLLLVPRFGTCSVSMDSDIDCYFWLVAYLTDRDIGKHSASLMAVPSSRAKQWQVMPDNSLEIDPPRDAMVPTPTARNTKAPVRYEPALGSSQCFCHRGRLFLWYRTQKSRAAQSLFECLAGESGKVEARLYCLSRSTGPIKALVDEAAESYRKRSATLTAIRRPAPRKQRQAGGSAWVKVATRPSRAMETVVLDEGEKERVRGYIAEYLDPGTRRWYAARGIPYRRGYLFHGPLGTGKTSLAFALAGVFSLDVFCVSLQNPSITEEDPFTLFDELPRQCLLLLEDIDPAGLVKRALHSPSPPPHSPSSPGADASAGAEGEEGSDRSGEQSKHARLSLSTLLNAIDGIASYEGRVLILTTNALGALDAALPRPGRVDLTVRFPLATRAQAEGVVVGIFSTVATQTTPEKETGGVGMGKGGVEEVEGKGEREREQEGEVREMARKVAEQIPENTFSVAELQGFLRVRKGRPEAAVGEAGRWVVERMVPRGWKGKGRRNDEGGGGR